MGKINLNLKVFTVGKYKGLTLESVFLNDPSYIVWANENLAECNRPHIPHQMYMDALEITEVDDYGVEELDFNDPRDY